MASQLDNGLCCADRYWGVCEQNNILNSVGVHDRTGEEDNFASNNDFKNQGFQNNTSALILKLGLF